MQDIIDRGRKPALLRAAREAFPLEPWDFWDPPFRYQTDKLHTFLLFLTDASSREWAIPSATADSTTLWLTDGENQVYYTARAAELAADEMRGLCRMLRLFPRAMPSSAREQLASYAARCLSGHLWP
jgi:hypothetical protein